MSAHAIRIDRMTSRERVRFTGEGVECPHMHRSMEAAERCVRRFWRQQGIIEHGDPDWFDEPPIDP